MSVRRFGVWLKVEWAAGIAACAAAVGFAGAAHAQFPDVLSAAECAGCAAVLAPAPAPFEGTWSTALTAADAEGWALADLYCVTACTPEGRREATAVLAAPRNAQRSAVELAPQLEALNVRPLRFGCDPLELADQMVSPWPLSIGREADRVVFRYEERGAVRSIAVGGGEPGPGASTARFERGALIVDTRTAALHAVERYTVSADGRWLTLDLAIQPGDSREPPLVATKRWVRTPNARRVTHGCDVQGAGLVATLWDFVDPRRFDAQRAAIVMRLARSE